MFTLMLTVIILFTVLMRGSLTNGGVAFIVCVSGDVALAWIFRDFIVEVLRQL